MANEHKENKGGFWSWLFWWKLDKEELHQQVRDYDSLKVTQSFRGVASLILLAFLSLTVLLAIVGWAPLDYAWSLVIYLPLIFLIYKGKRWAMLLMMLLWTLERGYSLVLVDNKGHISTAGFMLALLGWAFVMKGLYGAFKVEQIRKKNKIMDQAQITNDNEKPLSSPNKSKLYFLGLFVLISAIIGGLFYWYEIRPAQIKHDCSWVKRHQDAVPAKPGLTQEEINKDCNEIVGNPFYKSMTCNLKPIPPEPVKPAKDWWGEANAEEYKFCLHDKGL